MASESISNSTGGSTPTQRADLVHARATALGFDACGIASAADVPDATRLDAWLQKGWHAGMDWMARTRELRLDVRRVLPGACSVVMVARNYYCDRPPEPAEPFGRVSRYAWSRDYHRVLKKPLRQLAAYIASLEMDGRCWSAIDSGPLWERYWAVRAGIGWLGRNGMVVREDIGSWFFLGGIVTTVALRPDSPVENRCGACSACVRACPVNAIGENGMVDARRCIAYHTIENRGIIPQDLHPAFGDWVFGCDICLEVCPWNRRVPRTSEPDFFPRKHCAYPLLDEIEQMNDDDFRNRFAGTPIMRAKREGLQRNARIVRANRNTCKELS